MTPRELTNEIVKILDKKKALDITAIKTEELTIVSDYFVIATGTSNTHVKSLADDLEYEMGKLDAAPEHIEGRATGWILLDFGSVLVHLFQKDTNLVQQLRAVLFNTLAPDKSIFVGFGFNLGAVNILHIKADETFIGKDKNQLGKYIIYFLLYTVTKTVDRDKIRMLITGKPNIMNVTKEVLLYFTARIDIIHVGVDYHLKHHFRMIRTTTGCFIKLLEIIKIEIINNCIDYADRVVRSYVFINSLWKKNGLVGNVRTKM